MRRLPPLNALRAFEAAARNLSFREAGVELGVTATAISHQIKLLEESIGRPLFKRFPRPMRLTETGAALLPEISASLDRMSAAVGRVSAAGPETGLRVSATIAFASNVLLPSLPEWSAIEPDIDVEIHGSDHPVDLAAEGVDMAIRYAAIAAAPSWRPIGSDRFWAMASPRFAAHHGLAAPELAEPAAILDLPLVGYRWKQRHPSEPTWDRWEQTFAPERIGRGGDMKQLKLSEESHAIEAAAAGRGVVLASDVVTAQRLAVGELTVLCSRYLPGLQYFLVTSVQRRKDQKIALFTQFIEDLIQSNRSSPADDEIFSS